MSVNSGLFTLSALRGTLRLSHLGKTCVTATAFRDCCYPKNTAKRFLGQQLLGIRDGRCTLHMPRDTERKAGFPARSPGVIRTGCFPVYPKGKS